MSRIKKIQINEKEILVVDYSFCKEAEMIQIAQQAKELITGTEEPKLVISRYTNMYITPSFVRFFEAAAKEVKPYLAKNALIGLNKPKKMIVKGFNILMGTDYQAFETERQAVEFLLGEAAPDDLPPIFIDR